MKKIRNVFMVTMVLVVLMTGVAYGASYTERENVRGSVYNEEICGTKMKIHAVGTSTQAYTTATNLLTSTITVRSEIQEYTHSVGLTDASYGTELDLNPGEQVHSGYITRGINNDTVEYKHYATYYANEALMGTLEYIEYVGDQYYEE